MGKKNKHNHADHAVNTAPDVKKKWHLKDLNKLVPKTNKQKLFAEGYRKDNQKSFFVCGSAGTGKTYCALSLALEDVLDPATPYETVYIVRSVVPSRDMGFLPGSEEEKTALYESPYIGICDELFPFANSYKNLKEAGKIKFVSTSFLRGVTLKDCIVIVDEIQNLNFQEADTVMTRLGENSRVIYSGDWRQSDLNQSKWDVSGFSDFFDIVNSMKDMFTVIVFDREDIVRSKLVKRYIIQKEIVFDNKLYSANGKEL